MANLLKMADVQSIITLHARGWSGRKIARELNIDRETVGKHLARAASDSKPATAPAGIPGASDSKPASAPAGISNPQAALIVQSSGEQSVGLSDVAPESLSRCEPWRPSILVKLEAGLTAQRIYQDIVAEEGFEGSYYSVSRFVRKLGLAVPLPFRRMTSNRPLEDWAKLIGDVPSATAILDRFLQHAQVMTITGRSYRLKDHPRAAGRQAPITESAGAESKATAGEKQ